MGFSHNRSRKETQRRLDAEDPERRQVRNAIKRGRAPTLTMAQDAKGKIPERGTYRQRLDPVGTAEEEAKGKAMGYRPRTKRVGVVRMNNFIRYTIGAIFTNKAANAK